MGLAVPPERFVCRADDLMAYWAAVRAGIGIHLVAAYVRRQDPEVLPLPV